VAGTGMTEARSVVCWKRISTYPNLLLCCFEVKNGSALIAISFPLHYCKLQHLLWKLK